MSRTVNVCAVSVAITVKRIDSPFLMKIGPAVPGLKPGYVAVTAISLADRVGVVVGGTDVGVAVGTGAGVNVGVGRGAGVDVAVG